MAKISSHMKQEQGYRVVLKAPAWNNGKRYALNGLRNKIALIHQWKRKNSNHFHTTNIPWRHYNQNADWPDFALVLPVEEVLSAHPLRHDELQSRFPCWARKTAQELEERLQLGVNQVGEHHDQRLRTVEDEGGRKNIKEWVADPSSKFNRLATHAHSCPFTCMTLRVSACCILLRMARRIWSSCSPSSVPAREIRVDTSLPTKAAVNSEVRGSSSWLTTCMTYQRPLLPCSSLHWAICSRATDTYARRHSPPFWRREDVQNQKSDGMEKYILGLQR